MNTAQDFSALMEAVVGLDTSNALKQLETVNSNIILIRLWFSRAEVAIALCACCGLETTCLSIVAISNAA